MKSYLSEFMMRLVLLAIWFRLGNGDSAWDGVFARRSIYFAYLCTCWYICYDNSKRQNGVKTKAKTKTQISYSTDRKTKLYFVLVA